MSRPPSPGTLAPANVPDLHGALSRALARVDRRVIAVTLATSAALTLWSAFEMTFGGGARAPTPHGYLSRTISSVAMAGCLVFAALVADELIAAGHRRWSAYGLAVAAGSAVGAVLQTIVHAWLDLGPAFYNVPAAADTDELRGIFLFFEYLIWGFAIVSIYVNRRHALRAADRLNTVQVLAAVTQRRMLEARLQALQARVEPQFLFGTLAQVRELYEVDPPRAAQMLDQLIGYLRAALPGFRAPVSTLQQELALVQAYLEVMILRSERLLGVRIDAPNTLEPVRMPPMILLPLVNLTLMGSDDGDGPAGSLHISVALTDARIRVTLLHDALRAPRDGLDHYPRTLERRLDALYGGNWTLAIEYATQQGTRVVMEIPNEPADSHRR